MSKENEIPASLRLVYGTSKKGTMYYAAEVSFYDTINGKPLTKMIFLSELEQAVIMNMLQYFQPK